jgi:SNF2 family DNA or RNA helicase
LQALIPSSVQIAGKDPEEKREEAFLAFTRGDVRVIVTKPKIGGFGLNWQHCARQTFFPTHSYEQFYQSIRRSWRFGQKNPVQIDIVTTTGQKKILENMTRKAAQAEVMFDRIAKAVNFGSGISRTEKDNHSNIEVPLWLQ